MERWCFFHPLKREWSFTFEEGPRRHPKARQVGLLSTDELQHGSLPLRVRRLLDAGGLRRVLRLEVVRREEVEGRGAAVPEAAVARRVVPHPEGGNGLMRGERPTGVAAGRREARNRARALGAGGANCRRRRRRRLRRRRRGVGGTWWKTLPHFGRLGGVWLNRRGLSGGGCREAAGPVVDSDRAAGKAPVGRARRHRTWGSGQGRGTWRWGLVGTTVPAPSSGPAPDAAQGWGLVHLPTPPRLPGRSSPIESTSSPIEERGWQKPAKKEWTKSRELQENHSVTSAKQPQAGDARLVEVGPLARARASSEGSAGTKVQRPGHRPLQRDGQAHSIHLRQRPDCRKVDRLPMEATGDGVAGELARATERPAPIEKRGWQIQPKKNGQCPKPKGKEPKRDYTTKHETVRRRCSPIEKRGWQSQPKKNGQCSKPKKEVLKKDYTTKCKMVQREMQMAAQYPRIRVTRSRRSGTLPRPGSSSHSTASPRVDRMSQRALQRDRQPHPKDLREGAGSIEAWRTLPPLDGLPGKPLEEIQPATAKCPVYVNGQCREGIAWRVSDRVPDERRGPRGVGRINAIGSYHISDDARTSSGRDGNEVRAAGVKLSIGAPQDGHYRGVLHCHLVAGLQEHTLHGVSQEVVRTCPLRLEGPSGGKEVSTSKSERKKSFLFSGLAIDKHRHEESDCRQAVP
eukprot:SM000166S02482  [mRNA]  locus=s166:68260:71956:- [translate_table: standard]